MNLYQRLATLIPFLLLACANLAQATEDLEIHDAWAREAPPGAAVMAGYLTLHNHSSETYTLTNLQSPQFEKVEIHRTEERDGMTQMIKVSQVILGPKDSVRFQPGGMHLMLMKPKKPLKAGAKISLTLSFSGETSMQVTLPVKKAEASIHHDMQTHMH
ncbi:MAG TPA: copper chaperone PCu(A)C [Gammaproteobacteria bacterium]|nr:copper chaperone PCu(A)C [Gammaproteobacteria bacterium]